MISECSEQSHRIPASFVGDLSEDEQQKLSRHLASCPACRMEHERYAETLLLLRSAEDEAVPRHFFVYPPEPAQNPWQLFRQLLPRWQVATSGVALLILMTGILALSGFQVHADTGAWTVGFARWTSQPSLDIAALKAEILQAAAEKQRQADAALIQMVRSEIANSGADLSQQQQIRLAAVLTALESRFNDRLAVTAEDIRGTTQKSLADLHRSLSLQHEQGLEAVNTRVDGLAGYFEERSRQTDSILETLLDVVELRVRQTGDQK